MAGKRRLDVLLTERGLAPSRTGPQALILAARVSGRRPDGDQGRDPARPLVEVLVEEPAKAYVSRAGSSWPRPWMPAP